MTTQATEAETRADRRVFWLALLCAIPPLLFWLAWYPGFLSSDSVRMFAEIESSSITNDTPAAYSVLLWLTSRIISGPGLATLLQVVGFSVLIAVVAARTTRLGVHPVVAWLVAIGLTWMPAVASAIVAVEYQVALALALLWVFAESLEIARLGPDALGSGPMPIRLGAALGAVTVLHHGGLLLALLIGGGLAIIVRRRIAGMARPAAIAVGTWLIVQVLVFPLFGVEREVRPIGEAYAPEVAAVLVHDPGAFSDDDLRSLEAVAPLDVWRDAYVCSDGSELIEDREFDTSMIREDPAEYRSLVLKALSRNPATVIGHRLCAAGFLLSPVETEGQAFGTYVYTVPFNDLGLERETLWSGAFSMTKAMLIRTEQGGKLWLYWSPALPLYIAAAGYGFALWRRRWWMLAPAVVLAAVVVGSVATVREPTFVSALPLYVLAFLSLGLVPAAVQRR